MKVEYQASNLKPMLQFLVDHDYDFETTAACTELPSETGTFADQLKRREVKANLKIAQLIDKAKISSS